MDMITYVRRNRAEKPEINGRMVAYGKFTRPLDINTMTQTNISAD
jgi:hypothetical protein